MSASGSGTFDGDSLLQCVQKLSELTGPDKCTSEVEKGCVLVVQKICEGLTNYVKDRSDAARLRVVAECADALNTTIVDVVREVSYLTNDQSDRLESNLSAVISSLEREMFDVFLESVKRNVASCARLGLIEPDDDGKSDKPDRFPPYLAGSFLAIVRCRAQVERALREATLRRSEGTTYQFLALQTASERVVENICHELRAKLNSIRPQKADTYAIHVLFLINTLKNYLSEEKLSLAADTKRMLVTKASSGGMRTGRLLGDGPEGLTALENLERQGRVYVMCFSTD
jgi:signal transduction histidine kinase